MRIRKFLFMSFSIKFATVLLCVMLLFGHYLVGRIWFNPTASVSDIKNALRGARFEAVDEFSEDGLTGLMLAASQTNAELIQAFLDAGANINLRAKDVAGEELAGNTALHFACYNSGDFPGGYEAIKTLLEGGASVRIGNKRGELPIHSVMQIDKTQLNLDIIELLVKYGADVNAQIKKDLTILHLGAGYNRENWTRKFLKRFGSLVDVDKKNKKGLTPREYAYDLGFRDVASIIERGPTIIEDIGSRDEGGLTGLMLAVISNNREQTEKLINRGADLDARSSDEYKQTALHFAFIHQNVSMAKLLAESGANLKKPNGAGDLPIHFIMRLINSADRSRALDILTAQGADPNAQNEDGDTLLHLAVRKNDRKLIDELVREYGYQIKASIKNAENMTVLGLARKLERTTLISLLQQLEDMSWLPGLAPEV